MGRFQIQNLRNEKLIFGSKRIDQSRIAVDSMYKARMTHWTEDDSSSIGWNTESIRHGHPPLATVKSISRLEGMDMWFQNFADQVVLDKMDGGLASESDSL